MKVFDIKNPRHIEILVEELRLAKRMMTEASTYSEDEIWSKMSDDERWEAIASVRDDEGPDDADRYSAEKWDNIPDWLTDRMNISDFELAKRSQGGATMLRAIKKFSGENPNVNKFVSAYLAKAGRGDINDLTVTQSYDLVPKIHQLLSKLNPSPAIRTTKSDVNPYDMPGGSPTKLGGGNWTGD
jgi:hypothetical protein